MADEAAVDGLPYMTLAVYRLNPETGEKTVIKPVRTVVAGEVLMTSEFPPCSCFQCRKKRV